MLGWNTGRLSEAPLTVRQMPNPTRGKTLPGWGFVSRLSRGCGPSSHYMSNKKLPNKPRMQLFQLLSAEDIICGADKLSSALPTAPQPAPAQQRQHSARCYQHICNASMPEQTYACWFGERARAFALSCSCSTLVWLV